MLRPVQRTQGRHALVLPFAGRCFSSGGKSPPGQLRQRPGSPSADRRTGTSGQRIGSTLRRHRKESMPRMIELIRNSAVPAAIMRTASKGALALPPEEMVEILVFLSSHALFGEQARMTLAAWDEASAAKVCADPTTPFEIIEYFLDPKNRRPRLVPALLENPSVPELDLHQLAQEHSKELVAQMLQSPRVLASRNILHALATNPVLTPPQHVQLNDALHRLGEII